MILLARWVNREQQKVIEYLRTENAVLLETLGKKRILLTDEQRRRLAVKGKIFGRKQLAQVGTLFTPDTILRWHRQLVAQKWDYSDRKEKKSGRPRARQVIVDLTVNIACAGLLTGGVIFIAAHGVCPDVSMKETRTLHLSARNTPHPIWHGDRSTWC